MLHSAIAEAAWIKVLSSCENNDIGFTREYVPLHASLWKCRRTSYVFEGGPNVRQIKSIVMFTESSQLVLMLNVKKAVMNDSLLSMKKD